MDIIEQIDKWNKGLKYPYRMAPSLHFDRKLIMLTDGHKTLMISNYHLKHFEFTISIPKSIVHQGSEKKGNLKTILREFHAL